MRHSRSSLFLMELILAILFFSLSSAVCIQLFAKSHTLGRQTVKQNQSLIHTQNLAESFLVSDGSLSHISTFFPLCVWNQEDNVLTLYFDSNWNPTEEKNAVFMARLEESKPESDGLLIADIMVVECSTANEPLYKLQVKKHIPNRK